MGALFVSADHELMYIWISLLTSIMMIEKLDLSLTKKDFKVIGMIEIAGVFAAYVAVNLFKTVFF